VTDRRYDLHGLVEVVLADNLRPQIVREIEFQIGSFRSDTPVLEVPRIDVRPYAARPIFPLGNGEPTFYNLKGTAGFALRDEEARYAVVRSERGYTLYADYASFLINLYVQLLIAPQGYTMVHGAAYESSAGGVNLLAGAGGIGKTAVLGYAVRERGLRHLGDDVVIVGQTGRCLAFPRAFVLKSYHREGYAETFQRLKLRRHNFYGLKRIFIENAPFMGLAKRWLRRSGIYYTVADWLRPQPFLATVSPEDLFGRDSMASSGELRRIAYLDRVEGGRFAKQEIRPEALVNRLFAVIHYEWKDFLTHLVSLGALDIVDLPSYCEQVNGALRRAVAGREIMQLCVPVEATPPQLIDFLDRNGFF